MKNTETIFFKAKDGVMLNGIMYKNTNKTAKIIIGLIEKATNWFIIKQTLLCFSSG